jgi:cell wall-associated NlpC family hydrolase
MQFGYGQRVSKGSLLPGDLVFFFSPISHVGIYIGNGMMIHAPSTGDVVKIAPVLGNFAGAVRL